MKRASVALDIPHTCPNCGHVSTDTTLNLVVVSDTINETEMFFHEVDAEGMPVKEKQRGFIGRHVSNAELYRRKQTGEYLGSASRQSRTKTESPVPGALEKDER